MDRDRDLPVPRRDAGAPGPHRRGARARRVRAANLPPEDAYAQAALCLAEASIATADSEQDRAVARFDEALRLLREQRLLKDLGEARIAFARTPRAFGETTKSARLRRAREEFARMDAHELVIQIDRELAEAGDRGRALGPGP